MKKSFLDYYKTILEKVSFDPELLKKEYQKAKKMIKNHEKEQLDAWLTSKGLKAQMIRIEQRKERQKF